MPVNPIHPLCVLLAGAMALPAQEAADEAWTALDPIPSRIEVIRDELGFDWQLTEAGSFFAMGANVFKSAHELTVNGENFRAQTALQGPDSQFIFRSEMDGLTVERHVWLDQKRAAARHLEVVRNPGTKPQTVTLAVDSSFSYSWQDVYSDEGQLLEAARLQDEGGLLLKFDSIAGQSDFFLLVAGERAEVRPDVMISLPQRSIRHSLSLTIPPGESRAMASWIGQRNVVNLARTSELFDPFVMRRGPIRLGVPEAIPVADIVNFEVPEASMVSGDASSLHALNAMLEEKRLERGVLDLLWISAENQLSGTVEGGAATLQLDSDYGEVPVSIDELAAWQGSAGGGRIHTLFFRDGDVLSGRVADATLEIASAEGFRTEVRASDLRTLARAAQPEDGKVPEGSLGQVLLDTGEWLHVTEASELSWQLPWGSRTISWTEMERIQTPEDASSSVLTLKDGSRLVGFAMAEGSLTLATSRLGELEIQAQQIRGWWAAGSQSEVPQLDKVAIPEGESWVWLAGGIYMPARLSVEELALVLDGVTRSIPTSMIQSMQRSAGQGTFELELKGGEFLTGTLLGAMLALDVGEGFSWSVPVEHLEALIAP